MFLEDILLVVKIVGKEIRSGDWVVLVEAKDTVI